MDIDAASLTGLVGSAVGAFLACGAAFTKWMGDNKNETTQVTILREDRDQWKARAEAAEAASRMDREKLNQLILDQSDMKAQNAVMLEQLTTLRTENAAIKRQLDTIMGKPA